MELIGKSTINPYLFYTGKISGYIVWIVFLYSLSKNILNNEIEFLNKDIISCSLFVLGVVFTIVSLFSLGKSTRFGLPVEKTVLNSIYILVQTNVKVKSGLNSEIYLMILLCSMVMSFG